MKLSKIYKQKMTLKASYEKKNILKRSSTETRFWMPGMKQT